MNGWILTVLVALCCLSGGQGLECYSCSYGSCLLPSTISCSFGEICDSRTATPNGAVGITVYSKGCTSALGCVGTSSETILGLSYTISHSCCLTNLCNSGEATKLSLLAGVAALLSVVLMKLL